MGSKTSRGIEKVVPKPDLCICAVADRRYVGYIPLFIFCLKRAYPEYHIKILYRGELPNDIRNITGDTEIIEGPLSSYPDNKATLSSLRFLLGKDWFFGFKYAYFTDIDVLVRPEATPLLEQHVEVLEKTGLCYENLSLTHPEGRRMPGVHFIDVKQWFPIVQNAVRAEREALKQPNAAKAWDYDELMLHRIVEASGAGLPPPWIKPSEPWRWHGLHLGSYRRKKEGRRLRDLHARDRDLLKYLLGNSEFNRILQICQKHTPDIAKTIRYIRDFSKI